MIYLTHAFNYLQFILCNFFDFCLADSQLFNFFYTAKVLLSYFYYQQHTKKCKQSKKSFIIINNHHYKLGTSIQQFIRIPRLCKLVFKSFTSILLLQNLYKITVLLLSQVEIDIYVSKFWYSRI